VPESKVRKTAADKRKKNTASAVNQAREEKSRLKHDRTWVPWVFVPVGLLGVLWMVLYNVAGQTLGFMRALGDWNVLIGLVLIVASFFIATLWK